MGGFTIFFSRKKSLDHLAKTSQRNNDCIPDEDIEFIDSRKMFAAKMSGSHHSNLLRSSGSVTSTK